MNYSFNQPGANQVGPLGKRAGLDVKPPEYVPVLVRELERLVLPQKLVRTLCEILT